jgi:dienelactone hydrolase
MVCGLAATIFSASGAVKTEEVTYQGGGLSMKGLIAWDDAITGPRPGVLVVHEWWGNNDYARGRAKMLAELGYVGMAVDMFGDGKTADHPDKAGKFAGEALANLDKAVDRFQAALQVLHARPEVDPKRTAAIGYCFGGGVVLQMARLGLDLDAAASFHGSLGARIPAKPGAVKAKILVCHGGSDSFIPAEAIAAFKTEMDQAGADYQFISYEGALHGFSNPDATANGKKFDLPIAYQKEADEASWKELRALLEKVFAQP